MYIYECTYIQENDADSKYSTTAIWKCVQRKLWRHQATRYWRKTFFERRQKCRHVKFWQFNHVSSYYIQAKNQRISSMQSRVIHGQKSAKVWRHIFDMCHIHDIYLTYSECTHFGASIEPTTNNFYRRPPELAFFGFIKFRLSPKLTCVIGTVHRHMSELYMYIGPKMSKTAKNRG